MQGIKKLASARSKTAKLHNKKLRDCKIHLNENKYDIDSYDSIFIPPVEDAHFEHKKISKLSYPLTRRLKCGLIQFKTPSTLDLWIPNFFVDLNSIEKN